MVEEWPELDVLELLVSIDEHGSLGAAARRTGMAQPNATRRMRRLEAALGLPLLDRGPRGSRLTAQGTVIAHWARETLTGARSLLEAAAALRGERDAELRVGASMTIAEHLLPAWLGRLRSTHPGVRVHLQVQNSQDVADAVLAREHDVGFVESPTVPRGLDSAVVGHDDLRLVVAPGHPWARLRRPLRVRELAETPLVMREPGSGTRTTLDVALAEYPRAEPALEMGSGAAVRTAVLTGAGPAVLSSLATGPWIDRGELRAVPLPDLDLRRTLRAVWPAGPRLRGPAQELVHLARASGQSSQHAQPSRAAQSPLSSVSRARRN